MTVLAETLRTLERSGHRHTGAGRDAVEAAVPAVLDVPGKGACSSSSTSMVHRPASITLQKAHRNTNS